MDDQTLAFYAAEAEAYADLVTGDFGRIWLERFAERLPQGARVLDWGAGHGWAAAWLRDQGFAVEATDGSEDLAAVGRTRFGLEVRVEPFGALDAEAAFDGLWSSFALLHVPRARFAGHLAQAARALRPGGLLYLGLKEGTGEARDRLGRHYTYFGRGDLAAALAAAGFEPPEILGDQAMGMAGAAEPCLHAYAILGPRS
ncbi:MAG: class I SAM-dependent methyltransferase [Pseudomonadota bacterium]